MFGKNDYVFYGSEGVCRVEDIVTSPFSDVKTDGEYYVLRPVRETGGKMFVPTASAEGLMRHIMSREDVEALISQMDDLPLFREKDLKTLKERYSEAMRTCRPTEWVRVIRTVYDRVLNGRGNGKKVSDAEKAFSENAKKYLYMEISAVLGIPERDVEGYILGRKSGSLT